MRYDFMILVLGEGGGFRMFLSWFFFFYYRFGYVF